MLNFMIFAFVTSITPGPNNSMMMASGLRFGVKRTIPHLLGINIGFGFMFLLIGSILPFMPDGTMDILQIISMVLLAYIAIKIATASTNFAEIEADSKPWSFWRAAAFQWINPKAMMMAFAGATSYGLDNVTGAALFTVINAVSGVWIIAGASLRHFLVGNPLMTRLLYIALAAIMVATMVL